jgi:hypothetical protein
MIIVPLVNVLGTTGAGAGVLVYGDDGFIPVRGGGSIASFTSVDGGVIVREGSGAIQGSTTGRIL